MTAPQSPATPAEPVELVELRPLAPDERPGLPAEVLSSYTVDDVTAIRTFLGSYVGSSRHTQRAYDKECYRFLVWLRYRHRHAPPPEPHALLPRVVAPDINAYLAFLRQPAAFDDEWLQLQGWDHQPFRKPLSSESVKHALTILHKLFAAMREMPREPQRPYCLFNPVKLAHDAKRSKQQDEDVEHALTEEEWQAVKAAIEAMPRTKERDLRHYHRARWIMQLLYRAYLRREEAAQLTMGSFTATAKGWDIRLVGKGSKKARIIATAKLMEELKLYRQSLGLPPLPEADESRPAIMAVTGEDKGVTAQAIYLVCKEIFQRAADMIESTNEAAARRLRQASPHWLRHTGVSHTMEANVDPRYVQAQARHSSLNITARYDHKKRQAWREALDRAEKRLG